MRTCPAVFVTTRGGLARPAREIVVKDLLVFVSEGSSDEFSIALEELVKSFQLLDWTVAPPEFVDEVDQDSVTAPEDEPIRTLGATLRVSEAQETPGTTREEVSRFLEGFRELTSAFAVEFEVELDGVYAGDIRDGLLSKTLQSGLLATW